MLIQLRENRISSRILGGCEICFSWFFLWACDHSSWGLVLAQWVDNLKRFSAVCHGNAVLESWVWNRVDIGVLIPIVPCLVWAFTGLGGGVAEWLKAADCKSADVRLRRFESYPLHHDG